MTRTSSGKVRVVVRSRRVPTGTVEFSRPLYSPIGLPMGARIERGVLYSWILDEGHQRVVEEARKLACGLDLDLEIVDSRVEGPLARLLSSIQRIGASNPAIVVSPSTPSAATGASSVPARG